MKAYNQESGYLASRSMIMLLVIVLHIVALYAFMKATNFSFTRPVLTILRTKFIPLDPAKPEYPPPASAALVYPTTLMIEPIPLDIQVETPPSTGAILNMDREAAQPHAVASDTDESAAPISLPIRISKPHGQERYPGGSVKAHEAGKTSLKMCISTTGNVESAEVTQSSGYPKLDKAAVEMALDTQFKPAMRLGKPVVYCMLTGIRFRLH